MSFLIQVGYTDSVISRPVLKVKFHPIKGKAPKGLCNEDYTIWPLDPKREPSNLGWYEFSKKYLNGKLCPESHDGYIFPVIQAANEIEALNSKAAQALMTGLDLDRAKWLIYWCAKAVLDYSDKATLKFT